MFQTGPVCGCVCVGSGEVLRGCLGVSLALTCVVVCTVRGEEVLCVVHVSVSRGPGVCLCVVCVLCVRPVAGSMWSVCRTFPISGGGSGHWLGCICFSPARGTKRNSVPGNPEFCDPASGSRKNCFGAAGTLAPRTLSQQNWAFPGLQLQDQCELRGRVV